jgi:hypothetical protein
VIISAKILNKFETEPVIDRSLIIELGKIKHALTKHQAAFITR